MQFPKEKRSEENSKSKWFRFSSNPILRLANMHRKLEYDKMEVRESKCQYGKVLLAVECMFPYGVDLTEL